MILMATTVMKTDLTDLIKLTFHYFLFTFFVTDGRKFPKKFLVKN